MRRINGKVIGNPTVTPMAVPDWNQTDPKKADYIKNRPFYETESVLRDKRLEGFVMDEDVGDYIIYDYDYLPYGVYKVGEELLFEISINGETFSEKHAIKGLDENGAPYADSLVLGDVSIDIGRGGEAIDDDGNIVAMLFCVKPDASPDDEYRLKITKSVAVPMDEKFIPDNIARKADVKEIQAIAEESLSAVAEATELAASAQGAAEDAFMVAVSLQENIGQELGIMYDFFNGENTFSAIALEEREAKSGETLGTWRITSESDSSFIARYTSIFPEEDIPEDHPRVFRFASKDYIDEAIGDIETSLENIIAKYGLGGDAQ